MKLSSLERQRDKNARTCRNAKSGFQRGDQETIATSQRYKPCCLCMRRKEVEERSVKRTGGSREMVHARCSTRLRAFQYTPLTPYIPLFGRETSPTQGDGRKISATMILRTGGLVWPLERTLRNQESRTSIREAARVSRWGLEVRS